MNAPRRDLSTEPSHRPLLVRAHVATGIAHASSWGIGLDSLLAAELWARHKADLRAEGHEPPDLHDTTNPIELDLPLARCTAPEDPDLWHWAATTAYPENRPTDLPPEVHYWSGRVDHRAAEHLTPTLPAIVSDRQGRYRARRMPLLVTICSSVTWTCIGDPDAITELLSDLPAIGKKRSHGEGQVTSWEITDLPLHLDPATTPTSGTYDAWAAAHLHPDRTLGRPTPADCLISRPTVTDGGIGTAGLRPPYMHRSRQRTLHLPISLDHQATA